MAGGFWYVHTKPRISCERGFFQTDPEIRCNLCFQNCKAVVVLLFTRWAIHE